MGGAAPGAIPQLLQGSAERAGPVVMPVEPAAPGLFGAVADRRVALIFGTGAARGHAGLVVTIAPAKAAVIVRSGEFASQAWPLPE